MQLIPKWLRNWIAQLMPHQHSSGPGAVHVGHVSGSVQNVTQVHHHFYAAAQPTQEVAVPTSSPAPAPAQPPSEATPEQNQVLALMDPLPDSVRIRVLDFMRREFGTALVIALQPGQVYRVRRYVETINSRRREQ